MSSEAGTLNMAQTVRQAKIFTTRRQPFQPKHLDAISRQGMQISSHTNAHIGFTLVGASQPCIRDNINIAHTNMGRINAATTMLRLFLFFRPHSNHIYPKLYSAA